MERGTKKIRYLGRNSLSRSHPDSKQKTETEVTLCSVLLDFILVPSGFQTENRNRGLYQSHFKLVTDCDWLWPIVTKRVLLKKTKKKLEWLISNGVTDCDRLWPSQMSHLVTLFGVTGTNPVWVFCLKSGSGWLSGVLLFGVYQPNKQTTGDKSWLHRRIKSEFGQLPWC